MESLQCLACEAKPPKRNVFLLMEDQKGTYYLCSKCWIERNRSDIPLIVTPPKKKRSRRR